MSSDKHRTADCLQDIIDNIVLIENFVSRYDKDDVEADALAALERLQSKDQAQEPHPHADP